MKTSTYILAVAILGISAFSVCARPPEFITTVSITATALIEQPSTDNGTNTITPSPIVKTVTTKAVLKQLALDKFAQGQYDSTNFPTGAKLVAAFFSDEDAEFWVVDKTNNFLVDVSGILSLRIAEVNVFSGKVNDATGLANPTTTKRRMVSLIFDDTEIEGGGNIQFSLSGLAKSVTTDTKPNSSSGLYTKTKSHVVNNASGDGSYHGADMVISGSFSAGGKETLESM